MELIQKLIDLVMQFIDVVLHLDVHLNALIASVGTGTTYFVLFMIIFCETGLVILPFLPGDSLLFALGALTVGEGAQLSLPVLMVTLIVAGILGDTVNYSIGKYFGSKYLANSRFIKREHLLRTEAFYAKHGGKTIILARFIPIIRTFAPFVAGMAQMNYGKFVSYNVVGAVAWVIPLLLAGHFFGNLPAVKSNFHIVIFGIIGVSFLPVAIEFAKAWMDKKKAVA